MCGCRDSPLRCRFCRIWSLNTRSKPQSIPGTRTITLRRNSTSRGHSFSKCPIQPASPNSGLSMNASVTINGYTSTDSWGSAFVTIYSRKCSPINGEVWTDKGAYTFGEHVRVKWTLHHEDSKLDHVKVHLIKLLEYRHEETLLEN